MKRRPYLGEPTRKVVTWKGRKFVYYWNSKSPQDKLLDYFQQVCHYLGTA